MTSFEKISGAVRHLRWLRDARWLWDFVRPTYDCVIARLWPAGLPRLINGTDSIRLHPRLRGVGETYESDVWPLMMNSVGKSDVFVDVGANIGLYSVAVGKRVGAGGSVIAFEPDEETYQFLRENFRLNGLDGTSRPENKAVGSSDGPAVFLGGKGLESRLAEPGSMGRPVEVVCLDSYFAGRKVDIVKVDVEGHEQAVLEGARSLLRDPSRRPRALFVEVHPFAWAASGTTSDTMLKLLKDCGYQVFALDGSVVPEIKEYGEVVARPVVVEERDSKLGDGSLL